MDINNKNKEKALSRRTGFPLIAPLLLAGSAMASTIPQPPAPPVATTAAVNNCRNSTQWLAGAARTDITGPVTDISTGYTEPGVTMEGLATRLYARSFVIESPCSGQRIAYVNADVLHTYQSIKTGVIKRLAVKLPGVYNDSNVMIVGTHDHAAPSNISFRTLYNLANGVVGFDQLNYDIVVNGIVDGIVKAYEQRRAATIAIARGHVPNASFNRSLPAYLVNPDASSYAASVDDSMTLLRINGTDGKPIGAINWFAAHGTSFGPDVHLLDGDNKGRAARHMEDDIKAASGADFVAAFSNGPLGDVSPNQPNAADPGGHFLRPHDLDPSLDKYDDARIQGDRQYQVAMQLYAQASEPVHGGLFYKHKFVDFQNVSVDPAYTGGTANAKTCTAAIGAAFVSGTEEGGTQLIASLKEGTLTYQGIPINPLIPAALRACQAEKQVLLPVGDVSGFWINNIAWVDTIAPFQIFALGNVALVSSPFEQTTMAGRRLRHALAPTLAVMGISDVVVPTIANAYLQYMTTREEYATQNYEGGFTHFGPWSSAAFIQESDRLARALVQDTAVAAGPTPPDLTNNQVVHTPIDTYGVVNDDPPSGKSFGSVATDAAARYAHGPGNTVSVVFWSAHTRTAQIRQRSGAVPANFSWVEIQKQVGNGWQTIATDADPWTRFTWARIGGSLSAQSQVTVTWELDQATPGTYRIVHNGVARKSFLGLNPSYVNFSGASRSFTVY